jgi:WhiB family redox-sensing transcriptional regulator
MADAALALSPRWERQDWMGRAECRGHTNLFFAPLAERPQARERREAKARAICMSCPVLVQCRGFAHEHREHGFWGGESEEERALSLRRSTRAAS